MIRLAIRLGKPFTYATRSRGVFGQQLHFRFVRRSHIWYDTDKATVSLSTRVMESLRSSWCLLRSMQRSKFHCFDYETEPPENEKSRSPPTTNWCWEYCDTPLHLT